MADIIKFPGSPKGYTGESEPMTYFTCNCECQDFNLQTDGYVQCSHCTAVYDPETIWTRDEYGWVIELDEDGDDTE